MKTRDNLMRAFDGIVWWPARVAEQFPGGAPRFIANVIAPFFGLLSMAIMGPVLLMLMLSITAIDIWEQSK